MYTNSASEIFENIIKNFQDHVRDPFSFHYQHDEMIFRINIDTLCY